MPFDRCPQDLVFLFRWTTDFRRSYPPAAKSKLKKREGARKVKDFERAKARADGSLTPESATLYRGERARGNYLSQDRPDISFSSKELCRDFLVPSEGSFGKLKRLGRYCVGRPRLVYRFPYQEKRMPLMPVRIQALLGAP